MADFERIDYIKLMRGLNTLFPQIIFFPSLYGKVSHKNDDMQKEPEADICTFINEKKIPYGDKKTLVLEMARNDQFDALFPMQAVFKDRISDRLNDLDDGFNVINFYIETINREYVRGFNKSVQKDIDPVDFATGYFEKMVFEGKTYLLKDLGNEYVKRLVKELGVCQRSPISIYDAFEYYARKHYALVRMALEFETLYEQWKKDLEEKISKSNISGNYFYLGQKAGFYADFIKTLDTAHNAYDQLIQNKPDTVSKARAILNKIFVEGLKNHGKPLNKNGIKSASFEFHFMGNVAMMIEDTLERKSVDPYRPTDFVTLAGQVCKQLGPVKKKSQLEKNSKQKTKVDFSRSELENIRNYCSILKQFTAENEDWLKELEEKRRSEVEQYLKHGTSFDKIKMLYFVATAFSGRNIFPKITVDIIHGLYEKISVAVFANIGHNNEDGDEYAFDPEDKNYHADIHKLEVSEDWEKFVTNFLVLEFKMDDERDFIHFFLEERNRLEIRDDLMSYFSKGKHNTDSLIFAEYKKGKKNANDHGLFAKKLKKAGQKYLKWYNDTYPPKGGTK